MYVTKAYFCPAPLFIRRLQSKITDIKSLSAVQFTEICILDLSVFDVMCGLEILEERPDRSERPLSGSTSHREVTDPARPWKQFELVINFWGGSERKG